MRSRIVGVAVAAVAALTAVACSSSGSSSGSNSAGSGNVVKVMVMGQIGTPAPPTGSYPGIVSSAQAAAAAINKKGGINGHTIQVVSCNDNSDPNQAAECARDAVSDHVAAVVGLWTLYSTSVYPILQAANIPVLSSVLLGANELTSPVAFPWFSGIPGQYIAAAEYMTNTLGCKHPAVIYFNITAGLQAPKYIDLTLSKLGMKPSIHIPAGSGGLPDYAPAVQAAVSQGADCIFSGLAGSQTAQLILANIAAGSPLKVGGFGDPMATAVGQLGAKADGSFAIDTPLVSMTSNPTIAEYLADMKANGTSSDVGNTELTGWVGVQIFAQALAKISGTVDGASTIKALTGLHVSLPDFFNFSYAFNDSPTFSHVSNFDFLSFTVKNGTLVANSGVIDARSVALGSGS